MLPAVVFHGDKITSSYCIIDFHPLLGGAAAFSFKEIFEKGWVGQSDPPRILKATGFPQPAPPRRGSVLKHNFNK